VSFDEIGEIDKALTPTYFGGERERKEEARKSAWIPRRRSNRSSREIFDPSRSSLRREGAMESRRARSYIGGGLQLSKSDEKIIKSTLVSDGLERKGSRTIAKRFVSGP